MSRCARSMGTPRGTRSSASRRAISYSSRGAIRCGVSCSDRLWYESGMHDVFAPNLLKGKAALVTGGGSGIGAGIAKTFARPGAKVALVGRTKEKLDTIAAEIRSAGGEASTHACDVRDYAALASANGEAAS